MTSAVDASALLALLFREPGAERFEHAVGPRPAMSAVNWSEVVQKTSAHGVDGRRLRAGAIDAGLTVLDLTADRAERVAGLWPAGRELGLSLADRSCVDLAIELSCPAVTADREWTRLAIPGLDVLVLR